LPGDIHPDYAAAFQAFDRLRVQGYRPDFILDVGASIGVWALTIRRLYPEARTILCDPLFSRYHPRPLTEGCEIVEQALMDRVGETTFKVSKDLLNSSVLAVAGVSDVDEEIRIPATTVDALIAKMGVGGRGILKIDVQFAEHLVIAGAEKALREQIDFVVLELTLQPPNTDAKSMLEMIELMRTYGFDYSDDVGEWRSPVSGFLEQKDVLFIRRGISL
jgi:FkbM family methyltransferase